MKARLKVSMAGQVMRNAGDIIEGEKAARFVEAGIAEPIVETAVLKKETATRKRTVETR